MESLENIVVRAPRPDRRARQIDVVVIGAGHCGLAMSQQLSGYGIDHVVLDAGDIAQRWRAERWDNLSLLTPNWMLELPGKRYTGADNDGFMHKDTLAEWLTAYARECGAPVKRFTKVHCVPVSYTHLTLPTSFLV